MIIKGFPSVPKDLIEALEGRFPDRLPDVPATTLTEVNIMQGEQRVIKFLRTQFNKQNENILEK